MGSEKGSTMVPDMDNLPVLSVTLTADLWL